MESSRFRLSWWNTAFLRQPLSLPDSVLSSMFSLKEDNGLSNYVKSPDTPIIFYLRSFSMTVSQLKSIVDDWETRKYYYGEATTWLSMTAAMSSEEIVYIRYIGATERKTPFQRYTADFSSKTGPVLAKFLETVGRLCPIVLDSGRWLPSRLQSRRRTTSCFQVSANWKYRSHATKLTDCACRLNK